MVYIAQLVLICGYAASAQTGVNLADNLPSPTVAARDTDGFIYLAGTTYFNDLPATPGVIQPKPPPDCHANPARYQCAHGFIAKLSPNGAMLWATYLGGNGSDEISAIAVSPSGGVVVGGETTSTNLLPDRPGERAAPASLFIARLASDGSAVNGSAYFGGTAADRIQSLTLDDDANVYIAGVALSTNFPVTPGAYRTTGTPDQFVAKFDSNLKQLLFSSLLGTSAVFTPTSLALGKDRSLYVLGTGNPGIGSPGPMPVMVTRLTADATKSIYSVRWDSFFQGASVAVDEEGNAYVSTYQRRWEIAGPDSSITKLDPAGNSAWSTRVPGANISSMTLDSRGLLILTGLALDLQFQPTARAPRACLSALASRPVTTFVARFDVAAKSIIFAGYLNAAQSWVDGEDGVVAESAYLGLPRFSTLPSTTPEPGTVTCMANAASNHMSSLAPGEVLSIYGSSIGPAQQFITQLDTAGIVTRELGGITVTFDGVPSPILYAAPGQINLVAPFTLPPNKVRVELRRDGVLLAAFDRTVSPAHPGLFTVSGLRSGPLAALNQDGSINSASNPASPGSIVTIYATGLGDMLPAAVDGEIPHGPVSRPIAPFPIQLYSTSAGAFSPNIEYLGNAPELVQGMIQVNLRLPQIAPPDGVVTVLSANTGTIWVRQQP
ncbi:MAG: hypothetical protein IT165_35110 [Bryobacterales bacterium]|nr:hypothetical protein [Bryobacterales bacterium]